ncbi:hypothetical protein GCM10027423_49230 [Spirosoma arcticum]
MNFGITLPGLCETTGYSTQMLAFFGVLILEIVPTVYGIAQGLLWQAVVASIFVDIFFAVVAHWWHYDILRAKNQLVITNDSIESQNLRRQINKHSFYTNLFYFLIFVSGCIKFFFFYKAYVFFDAIAGGALVCYLLGALLHITYTGYFLYTSRFHWFMHNEFRKYLNTNAERFATHQPNPQPIQTSGANIQFNTLTKGLHKIYKTSDGQHYFETFGILTDKELSEFVKAQQNPIARDVIAREGLSQQLLNLGLINAGAVNLRNATNGITNNATSNTVTVIPSTNN